MRGKVLAVALVAVALGTAGCGGSGSRSSGSSASASNSVFARAPTGQLTTAQLKHEALAVCRRAEAQRARSKAGIYAQVLAFQAMKVAEMQRLKPPAELRDRFAAYTRALADRLTLFRALVQARGHTTSRMASDSTRLQAQEKHAAQRLGLLACSQD